MTAFTNREQAAARAEGEKSPSGPAPGDISARLDSEEKAFFVRSALALALLLFSSSAMNTAVFPCSTAFSRTREMCPCSRTPFFWLLWACGRLSLPAASGRMRPTRRRSFCFCSEPFCFPLLWPWKTLRFWSCRRASLPWLAGGPRFAWDRGVSGIGMVVGAAFGVWSTKAFADNDTRRFSLLAPSFFFSSAMP